MNPGYNKPRLLQKPGYYKSGYYKYPVITKTRLLQKPGYYKNPVITKTRLLQKPGYYKSG